MAVLLRPISPRAIVEKTAKTLLVRQNRNITKNLWITVDNPENQPQFIR